MENQDKQTEIFNLRVDDTSSHHIKTIATWAVIIVITSLIGYVVGFIDYFKKRNQYEGMLSEDEGSLTGFMVKMGKGGNLAGTIISTLIGLLLCYFLYQFSVKAKRGVENMSQPDLNEGLVNFRNYFVTVGIVCMILLALMLIVLVFLFSF